MAATDTADLVATATSDKVVATPAIAWTTVSPNAPGKAAVPTNAVDPAAHAQTATPATQMVSARRHAPRTATRRFVVTTVAEVRVDRVRPAKVATAMVNAKAAASATAAAKSVAMMDASDRVGPVL